MNCTIRCEEEMEVNLKLTLGRACHEGSRSASQAPSAGEGMAREKGNSFLPDSFLSLARSFSEPAELGQKHAQVRGMDPTRRCGSLSTRKNRRYKDRDMEFLGSSEVELGSRADTIAKIKRQSSSPNYYDIEGPIFAPLTGKQLEELSDTGSIGSFPVQPANLSRKRRVSGSGSHGVDVMKQMPSVMTTGSGPDGRTVEGFLYKYMKGQVRIVCLCHGNFLSPAEFVKHAGGKDVSNPMQQITVYTAACPN